MINPIYLAASFAGLLFGDPAPIPSATPSGQAPEIDISSVCNFDASDQKIIIIILGPSHLFRTNVAPKQLIETGEKRSLMASSPIWRKFGKQLCNGISTAPNDTSYKIDLRVAVLIEGDSDGSGAIFVEYPTVDRESTNLKGVSSSRHVSVGWEIVRNLLDYSDAEKVD